MARVDTKKGRLVGQRSCRVRLGKAEEGVPPWGMGRKFGVRRVEKETKNHVRKREYKDGDDRKGCGLGEEQDEV
jgi:hypothetical protein